MAGSGRSAVYAALIGNILVAATKAVAAFVTGSSAMLSEAVHSVVDTGNEILLLHGMRRSHRRPNRRHPLGYGRELYFWSFIVALLLFAAGAGVSIVQGILHIRAPEPIENVRVSYVVLGLSLLFEGGSWVVSFRGFRREKGDLGYWAAIRASKNPPQFMVLLEDSAAIIGIIVAIAGTWASVALGDPRLDGVASVVIGLLLAAISVVLARESKGLLIGEQADPELQRAVFAIASQTEGIAAANGLITVQLAPDQVVAALSLAFESGLDTERVEAIVADMERRLRQVRPDVFMLFVKPQSGDMFGKARSRHFGPAPAAQTDTPGPNLRNLDQGGRTAADLRGCPASAPAPAPAYAGDRPAMTDDPKPPMPDQQQPVPGHTADMDPKPDHGEESYRGSGKLEGKRAVITGGDSGIGRAVAIAFAREGADVLIAYLNEEDDAAETARWVEQAGRRCVRFPGDISDAAHCRGLIERAVAELGGIDILVNNAAHQMTFGEITDIPDAEWDLTFRTNIHAMFYLTKAAVPHMKEGSAIINTTSVNADTPSPELLAYATTKGAIQNFTGGLAQLLAEKGIRVNCVAPGPVWTPLIPSTMPPEKVKSFGKQAPIGRPAQPRELAPVYVLLASPEASYVSGATVAVTGGKPIL